MLPKASAGPVSHPRPSTVWGLVLRVTHELLAKEVFCFSVVWRPLWLGAGLPGVGAHYKDGSSPAFRDVWPERSQGMERVSWAVVLTFLIAAEAVDASDFP